LYFFWQLGTLLAKEYNKDVIFYPAENGLQAIRFFDPETGRYIFIADAPSINESQESISDADILARIDEFLHQGYVADLLLFISYTENHS
jgi:hypothetical protein